MQVLSIISHKGGSGKTSSAVMLAEDLAQRGLRVLLVDADRQNSSGLLLGIDSVTGTVTSTSVPRLRYLSCGEWSLQEVPARLEELYGRFDAVVVDTPSLDDPLARTWLCLSTAALLVVPVEPLSIWTLPAAEAELAELRAMSNPRLNLLGILPTLYNVDHLKQRRLLQELTEPRSEQVLSPPIPWDAHLAQRGAQRGAQQEHPVRQPQRETRNAYHAVNDTVFQALGVEALTQNGRPALAELPAAAPEPVRISPRPAAGVPVRLLLCGAAALLLISLLGFVLSRMWSPPAAAGMVGRAAAASTGKDGR